MMHESTRRAFLGKAGVAALGMACADVAGAEPRKEAPAVPSYLRGYEEQYAQDPRQAACQWFREARFGLFLHYGLYSLLGRHEWVQYRERIPVSEYAKLKDRFRADRFDADFITDLACEARMKYVNITTRHHESFCLFETRLTDFNSRKSPARRDLVKELAESCRKKKLGLFLYYSHGRDWKHPHAPNNGDWGGSARPAYDPPEPSYAYGKDHDLQKYLDFMTAQITELLTQYGPVAGIWLDGIAVPLSGDRSRFKCQELYDHIHRLQPQVLVSYKQGLLGTEDFLTPEHRPVENKGGKPAEINTTLQEEPGPEGRVVRSWGHHASLKHVGADAAMKKLALAADWGANLLLNTGPLGDGSIHPEDVKTLREVGRNIEKSGFPKPAAG
jgi:alpha-L-fucosidase